MLSRAKISRYKLKKLVQLFSLDIQADKTAILATVNRNTVNRWYMLFRKVIYLHRTTERRKLTGEIEVDESYFGPRRIRGRATKRGRGTHKQPVFGVFERNGAVYTEIVPNCQKSTLQPLILGKVAKESIIHSDGWRGYDGLVDVGYDRHLRVNHSKHEFSNKERGCHINGIESFWSFVKRRFTSLNGIQKKYFDLHLKECEWRWSRDYKTLEKELWTLLKTTDEQDLLTLC
jgi:transposase